MMNVAWQQIRNQAKEGEESIAFAVPDIMIPVYCLSRIDQSLSNSPFEGFMHPDVMLIEDHEYCRVIVDQPVSISVPDRVLVDQTYFMDDEYFLVWNGKRADIVSRQELKNEKGSILGAVIL